MMPLSQSVEKFSRFVLFMLAFRMLIAVILLFGDRLCVLNFLFSCDLLTFILSFRVRWQLLVGASAVGECVESSVPFWSFKYFDSMPDSSTIPWTVEILIY